MPKRKSTGGTITSNARTGTATVSKSGTNPGYSAASVRGLTSSDPANVNRNREAAARYAASARDTGGGNDNYGRNPLGAAGAAKPPMQVMKRTYLGGPPPGYDPAKQGEWNYYKTEMVDAPNMGGASAPSTRDALMARIMGHPFGRLFAPFVDTATRMAGNAPATKPMKSGGEVKKKKTGGPVKAGMRGCGCATKGTKGGKMR